jgi:hypothetical protein
MRVNDQVIETSWVHTGPVVCFAVERSIHPIHATLDNLNLIQVDLLGRRIKGIFITAFIVTLNSSSVGGTRCLSWCARPVVLALMLGGAGSLSQ